MADPVPPSDDAWARYARIRGIPDAAPTPIGAGPVVEESAPVEEDAWTAYAKLRGLPTERDAAPIARRPAKRIRVPEGQPLADIEAQQQRVVDEAPSTIEALSRALGGPSSREELAANPDSPRGRVFAKAELLKRGISPRDEAPGALLRKELRREVLADVTDDEKKQMLGAGVVPEGHELAAQMGVVTKLIADAGGIDGRSIPMARRPDGTYGIDETDARRKIYQRQIDLLRAENPAWSTDPALDADLSDRAEKYASTIIAKARAIGTGIPFVTADTAGLRASILALPESIRPLAALLVPRFDVVRTGAMTKTESLGSDPLTYYSRLVGSTFLGALISTADKDEVFDVITKAAGDFTRPTTLGLLPWEPENESWKRVASPTGTDFLMTGGDIFAVADKVGYALTHDIRMAPARAVLDMPGARQARRGLAWMVGQPGDDERAYGYAAGLAVALLEPDPSSLALYPFGKALHALKGAYLGAKVSKIAVAAEKVAADVMGGGRLTDMLVMLRKVSPALEELFVADVGQKLGLDPGVAERLTVKILPALRRIEDRIGAARAVIAGLGRTHAVGLTHLRTVGQNLQSTVQTEAAVRAQIRATVQQGLPVPPALRTRASQLGRQVVRLRAAYTAAQVPMAPVIAEIRKQRGIIQQASRLHMKTLTKPIRDAILQAGAGRDLTPATDAEKFVRQQFAETAQGFADSARVYLAEFEKQGFKLLDDVPTGGERAKAIMDAIAKDHTIPVAGILGRLEKAAKTWSAAWDPRVSKRGVVDEALHELVEGYVDKLDAVKDELASLAGTGVAPPDKVVFLYADQTANIPLERGVSWMNATHPQTLWTRARSQILRAVRATEEAAAEAAALQRAAVTQGEVGAARRAVAEAGQVGDIYALKALSRMWTGQFSGTPAEKASGELTSAAIRLLRRSATYQEFSEAMRAATHEVGSLDPRQTRAVVHGLMGVASAAFLDDAELTLIRKIGGRITAEEARDANALLLRAPSELGSMERGLDTLKRLGMPFTTASHVFDDFKDTSRRLVAVMASDEGKFFLPKNIVEELERATGSIVKELTPWNRGPATPGGWTKWAIGKTYHAWKVSVVTGMFLPRLAYSFANTGFADTSAVMWSEGGATAGRVFFDTLPAQAPLYGRVFMKWQSRLEKWAGGKPVLGSIVNTAMNPALSQVFTGASQDAVRVGAKTYTLGQLRTMLVEDGIMSSEIHSELYRLMHELSGGRGPLAKLRWWQREIAKHNVLIQQRQRASLYLELLRKGADRREARKRTMAALYDYKHGFARGEMEWVVAMDLPFYRWWRHALGQSVSSFLEPIVKPDEAARAALLGQTAAQRARKQISFGRGMASWAWDDEGGEDPNDAEDMMVLGRAVAPGWLRGQTSVIRDATEMERASEAWRDRNPSHVAEVFPSFTAISAMHWTLSMMTGLATLTAGMAVGMYDGATGRGSNFAPAPGVFTDFVAEPLGGLVGPAWKEVIVPLLSSRGERDDRAIYVTPEQARLLQFLHAAPMGGAFFDAPLWDGDRGRHYTGWRDAALVRLLPGLLEIPPYIRAANNPAFEQSWLMGMKAAGLDILGLKRQYPYSVRDMQEVTGWKQQEWLDRKEREEGELYRAPR